MGLSYLIGIVLAALSIRTRVPRFALRLRSERDVCLLVAVLAAGLVAAFGVEAHALDTAAAAQRMPDWERALPLATLYGNGASQLGDARGVGTLVEVLGIVQSLLLLGLWAVLRGGRMTPTVVGIVTVAASLLGIEAFAMRLAGPDIYAYVGFGLVADPYHPAARALAHGDLAISQIWGTPLPPSPYGPAWNALCRALDALAPSLDARLWALRALGAGALAAVVAALVALRKPVTAALVALDPTLWHVYVTEAHNDIVAIALLAAALVCGRRKPLVPLAIVLVVLAGAVKLPFIALAAVVFAATRERRPQWLAYLTAIALTAAVSFRFGGAEYAWALHRTLEIYPKPLTVAESLAHAALAAIALGALAFAFVRGRYAWGAAWSPIAFGQFTAWQYLGWGLPYAFLDETAGALYVAFLPVSAFEVTLVFNASDVYVVSRILLCAATLAVFVISTRRRHLASRASSLRPISIA
jgi:hypothetical protein